MSEPVPSHIAAQRCQQARSVEVAGTLPDFSRSEAFFEDLCSEPPPLLRLRRDRVNGTGPLWSEVFAAALGLRRA